MVEVEDFYFLMKIANRNHSDRAKSPINGLGFFMLVFLCFTRETKGSTHAKKTKANSCQGF